MNNTDCKNNHNYDELLTYLYKELFRYTLSIIHNLENTEDILQKSIISYLEYYKNNSPAKPEALLKTIVRNNILTFFNENKKSLNLLKKYKPYENYYESSEETAINDIRKEEILRIINTLPNFQASLMRDLIIEGMTISEISRKTGIHKQTLYTRKNLAFKKIKVMINRVD